MRTTLDARVGTECVSFSVFERLAIDEEALLHVVEDLQANASGDWSGQDVRRHRVLRYPRAVSSGRSPAKCPCSTSQRTKHRRWYSVESKFSATLTGRSSAVTAKPCLLSLWSAWSARRRARWRTSTERRPYPVRAGEEGAAAVVPRAVSLIPCARGTKVAPAIVFQVSLPYPVRAWDEGTADGARGRIAAEGGRGDSEAVDTRQAYQGGDAWRREDRLPHPSIGAGAAVIGRERVAGS